MPGTRKKPTITTRSAKQKARNLQNDIRDLLRKHSPDLEAGDIVCAIMGENGMDIKLSPAARKQWPFAIEAKARARSAIYTMWEQAARNADGLTPMVVLRVDRKNALAIMDFKTLIEMLRKSDA